MGCDNLKKILIPAFSAFVLAFFVGTYFYLSHISADADSNQSLTPVMTPAVNMQFVKLPVGIQNYIRKVGSISDYQNNAGFRKRLALAAKMIPNFNGNDVDALTQGGFKRFRAEHDPKVTNQQYVKLVSMYGRESHEAVMKYTKKLEAQ